MIGYAYIMVACLLLKHALNGVLSWDEDMRRTLWACAEQSTSCSS